MHFFQEKSLIIEPIFIRAWIRLHTQAYTKTHKQPKAHRLSKMLQNFSLSGIKSYRKKKKESLRIHAISSVKYLDFNISMSKFIIFYCLLMCFVVDLIPRVDFFAWMTVIVRLWLKMQEIISNLHVCLFAFSSNCLNERTQLH